MIPLYNFSAQQKVLLCYALNQFLENEGVALRIPTREGRALADLARSALRDQELAGEAICYAVWFYSRIMSGEDATPPTIEYGYQCLPIWFSRWGWDGAQSLADCARAVMCLPEDETLQSLILQFLGAMARSHFGPNWITGDLTEDLATALALYSG